MTPDMTIFYVTDPEISADFYSIVLERAPEDLSPGFALFLLPNGLKIGLWKKEAVTPAMKVTGCGAELVLHAASLAEVEAAHANWKAAGIAIIEPRPAAISARASSRPIRTATGSACSGRRADPWIGSPSPPPIMSPAAAPAASCRSVMESAGLLAASSRATA